ncbi:AraC family transcriptional regulator [Nocardioides campestrisoli]|uniref:AraC family transcriptional regulator n=1 Tax=Nocardioides campestrisoli TaxID=2736757 RepID=UPI001C62B58F|nr:helix-turn-helix domain-containing protein [Nocardioides campestrisoli]
MTTDDAGEPGGNRVDRAADGRGILYPAALPTFHREPAPEPLATWVRWFWIPEWDLAPGRVSRQHVIAFPASNLVVEQGLVALSGPTTRRWHRDLTGHGWVVGAHLRPAAVPLLVDDPGSVRDDYRPLDLPDLHASVVAAMTGPGSPAERRSAAVTAYGDWLLAVAPEPDDHALLANAMADAIDSDPEVLKVEHVAERLGVSPRTVQRLARRYVGLPPAAMIRRRRLQEAAERIRTDPSADLAGVAAELGYADQAHLAADFRTVLGLRPSDYRVGDRPAD